MRNCGGRRISMKDFEMATTEFQTEPTKEGGWRWTRQSFGQMLLVAPDTLGGDWSHMAREAAATSPDKRVVTTRSTRREIGDKGRFF
jgi:hypothetical protein